MSDVLLSRFPISFDFSCVSGHCVSEPEEWWERVGELLDGDGSDETGKSLNLRDSGTARGQQRTTG